MLKQSPSRNQRSKGFKVKDVLQISVLLATCFWLLYQAKLTYHNKHVSLEDSGNMSTTQVDSRHALLAMGRKGLNPLFELEFEKREDEDDESKLKEVSGGDDEKTEEEEPELLEDLIDEDDGGKGTKF